MALLYGNRYKCNERSIYTCIYMAAGNVPYGPHQRPWSESVSSYAKLQDGSYMVSPPSIDPLSVYPKVAGVDEALYQVPSTGLSSLQRHDANSCTLARTRRYQVEHIGYQTNQAMDYAPLRNYLDIHLNNAGDPFTENNNQTNTRWIERNVLDYFASLWNAKWPHDWADPETYWGYTLTMGASEGNIHALWNARDYLQGKTDHQDCGHAAAGRESRTMLADDSMQGSSVESELELVEHSLYPIAFFSEESHYSIAKAAAMINIPTFYQVGVAEFPGQCPLEAKYALKPGEWPREVPSKGGGAGPGSIDGDALCTLVEFFASRKYPVIVVFNYGSTFKGAYDEVEAIGTRLVAILGRHGMLNRAITFGRQRVERQGYWIHVDGALGASYMPFLEMARRNGMTELGADFTFDFRLPFVSSIVTSGHKWMGAPWPCGVCMTRTKLLLMPPSDKADYIGTPDTTLAGSRNGITPLLLWNFISTHPYERQVKTVLRCMELAEYTFQSLTKLQQDIGLRPLGDPLTAKPRRSVQGAKIRDYENLSLSGMTIYVNGVPRRYCHVYVINEEKINRFVSILKEDGAFPEQNHENGLSPCMYATSE